MKNTHLGMEWQALQETTLLLLHRIFREHRLIIGFQSLHGCVFYLFRVL